MRTEIMRAVSFSRLLVGVAIASSLGIGYAIGAQPHMQETIVLLKNARTELTTATPQQGRPS